MSTEDADNETSPTPPLPGLLVSTTELVPPRPAPPETADPLPVVIALVCIFLLLATFLIFLTLCKPAALDQPRERLPHHPADASEPQLRLWRRLGSRRCSVRAFRRGRPVSQSQLACPRSLPASPHRHATESTKM